MKKKEETFLLVSLNESKAKKLAQVISNETCRKILDSLAKKKATETELAKELEIPLSTVHYNLQHLTEAKLVTADEFHYSEKGKEVLHYSIANKYVIIAPEGVSDSFKNKLKSLLPVALILGAVGLTIQFFSKVTSLGASKMGAMESIAAPVAREMMYDAEETVAEKAMQEVAPRAVESTPQIVEKIVYVTQEQNLALWFVLGAVFALVLYFIVELIRRKLKE